jgi:glycerol-3-phosphate dehydrogenase
MKNTFRRLHSTARAFRRGASSLPRRRPLTTLSATTVFAVTAITVANSQRRPLEDATPVTIPDPATFPRIPPREEQLSALKRGDGFDVLIIGGGASGAGCALDAASRGLSVALVERDDFASGTSSRSTKLVHGGVRYLEKAFRVQPFPPVCELLCRRRF